MSETPNADDGVETESTINPDELPTLREGAEIRWNDRRERATVESATTTRSTTYIRVETVRGAHYRLRVGAGLDGDEHDVARRTDETVLPTEPDEYAPADELVSIEIVADGAEVEPPVEVGDVWVSSSTVDLIDDEAHEVVEIDRDSMTVEVAHGGERSAESTELSYVEVAERVDKYGLVEDVEVLDADETVEPPTLAERLDADVDEAVETLTPSPLPDFDEYLNGDSDLPDDEARLVTDGGRDEEEDDDDPGHAARVAAQLRIAEDDDEDELATDGGLDVVDDDGAEWCDDCQRYRLSCAHDDTEADFGAAEPSVEASPFDALDAALGRLSPGVSPGATIEREGERLDVEVPSVRSVEDERRIGSTTADELIRESAVERVARFDAVDEAVRGMLGETTDGDVVELRVRDGELLTLPVDVVSMPSAADDVDPAEYRPRAERLAETTVLSEREAEVRALKEIGLTHEAIAEVLDITKSTVDEYSVRIKRRITEAETTVDELDAGDEVDRGDGIETDGGVELPEVVDVTAHVSAERRLFCWFGRLDGDEAAAVDAREDVEIERIEAAIMTELPDEWLDRAEWRLPTEGRRDEPAPRLATLTLGDGEAELSIELDADAVDAMTPADRHDDRDRGRLVTDGGHDRVDVDEELVGSRTAVARAADGGGTAYSIVATDVDAHPALDAVGERGGARLYLVITDGGTIVGSGRDRHAVVRDAGERWIHDAIDRLDERLDDADELDVEE